GQTSSLDLPSGSRLDTVKAAHTLKAKELLAENSHHVEIAVAYGTADVLVDGRKVGTVNLNPTRGKMSESLNLSGDYAAYPCLGRVACSGSISDIELRHYRSPNNIIAHGKGNFPEHSSLQLRTRFTNAKTVRSAVLKITARGIYDAYLNGTLVNKDHFFCPGFTQYDRTHLFQTYDVTQFLQGGENTFAVLLSEGWWSGAATFSAQNWNFFGDRQSLLARLTITYSDGTTQDVVTSPDTWQCSSDGAMLYASMFQGEVVDGRRQLFAESSNWHKATVVTTDGTTVSADDYSGVQFIEQSDLPVHPIDTLAAISCTEVRPEVFVYDMGQNLAGVPLVVIPTDFCEGTTLRFRYGEMLTPDLPQFGDSQGELFTENYRAAISQDIFIVGDKRVFSPRHTLHGFRYIEITGTSRPLPLSSVKAVALSSLTRTTAHYECSDTLVNRLWQNILWSARSNFVSIPTDCPQRNERMGWSGDISVFSHTATYLSDVEEFLRRHLRAMRDTQTPDGRFPDVAPMRGEGFGGLLWGSAGITVAWETYRQWGNAEILREHYDAMVRYINYIQKDYIDPGSRLLVQHHQWGDLGDWLSPLYDNDDKSLLWECYYIHDLDLMSRIAGILGRTDEAEQFSRMRDERKDLFRKTYLHPSDYHTVWSAFDNKRQGETINTPASYILPLAFDICEGIERESIAKHLVQLIESDNYRLMVGFIGVPWIGEALSRIQRSDLLYRILTNTSYPSWLYPVTQGATTIWERLNSYVAGEGFPAGNSMNSFNHYSFGAVGSWLIERSLGITVENGNDSIVTLRPMPDSTRNITWARGYYDSRKGRIESSWEILPNSTARYKFSIPKGVIATVEIPGKKPKRYKAGQYKVTTKIKAMNW
ncbi:MAG: family 78 glycoside hydrolase catalytic domain, partial [Bacteroidaceae bacterium]|nr:family 78 glycoside hydrolase catalytic domain [Bacteroidaceae bacterium]